MHRNQDLALYFFKIISLWQKLDALLLQLPLNRSFMAPTKLVPLSDQIHLGDPPLLMNWRRTMMKSSVPSDGVEIDSTSCEASKQTNQSFRGSAASLNC